MMNTGQTGRGLRGPKERGQCANLVHHSLASPQIRTRHILGIGVDNMEDEADLAIGVASVLLSGASAPGAWVVTDDTTSYEVSAETSATGL